MKRPSLPIQIDGVFHHQRVAVGGSGAARHIKVRCQQAEVFISRRGNAFIYAEQSMKVVISGSGNTYYYGFPQVSSTLSGTGRVIAAN